MSLHYILFCLQGTTCTQGDIRLRGGSATSGRVEICNKNIWGTVCDDSWGATDARVACRQLGLPFSSELKICGYVHAHFVHFASSNFHGVKNDNMQLFAP